MTSFKRILHVQKEEVNKPTVPFHMSSSKKQAMPEGRVMCNKTEVQFPMFPTKRKSIPVTT